MGTLEPRPFSNFRSAITDPAYFFGQKNLLKEIQKNPFEVRYLIGASRMGKTSLLHAIQWHLLEPDAGMPRRAFPLFLDLNLEMPKSLDNFLYLVIAKLRKAVEEFKKVPGRSIRRGFREFLQDVTGGEISLFGLCKFTVKNPDQDCRLDSKDFREGFRTILNTLRNLDFQGVCILLDNADFIVQSDWSDSFSGYFNSLKTIEFSGSLGLILSGYKSLKDYKQLTTSPLSLIADEILLKTFPDTEVQALIQHRCQQEKIPLSGQAPIKINEWAGYHPYLTHQALNNLFNCYSRPEKPSTDDFEAQMLSCCCQDFATWWLATPQLDSLDQEARSIYQELVSCREVTCEQLATRLLMSKDRTQRGLELLVATGVVQSQESGTYKIGSQLFENWVRKQLEIQ